MSGVSDQINYVNLLMFMLSRQCHGNWDFAFKISQQFYVCSSDGCFSELHLMRKFIHVSCYWARKFHIEIEKVKEQRWEWKSETNGVL